MTQGLPERPSAIATAVKLMQFGAAFTLVTLALGMMNLDEQKQAVRDEMIADDPKVSADAIDTAITVGITFAILSSIIITALWMWMAAKNGQGRSWARAVGSTLAGVNIMFSMSIFNGSSDTLDIATTVVNAGLALAIVVLMWKPESSEYYRAASAA
jgi:hypothetical protein